MDGFVLKKIVSLLLHIIPGALLLLLGALLLRRWFPRIASWVSVLLCVLLLLGSMPPVSNAIVGQLEHRYPILPTAPADTQAILVLGYGHMYTPERPANSVLMAGALSRLSEGVRLWKTRPESVLILSGAKFRSEISHAEAMQRMALELGVPKEKTLLLVNTRDTEDEIIAAVQYLRQISANGQSVKQDAATSDAMSATGNTAEDDSTADNSTADNSTEDNGTEDNGSLTGRLIVTSSATHLPRAALMLARQQVNYSLAPTDFLVLDAPWFRLDSYFLRNLDRAIHEWVGMAWYRWRP